MKNFKGFAAVLAAMVFIPSLAMAQTTDGLTPYGQVRAWTGYIKQSKEVTAPASADTDYSSRLTSSRFGVKGKTDDLEGVIEMGLDGTSDDSTKNIKVSTRKIYATWTASPDVKLLFGQDEAPYTFYSMSSANDETFSGFGSTSQSRDFQVKATMYGFYIDFLNPTTKLTIGSISATSANTDVKYPKIAFGYDYKMESEDKSLSVLLSPGVAYQSLKINKSGDPLDSKNVNSILAYFHATVKMGGFSILANAGYGINAGNLGLDYSKALAAAQSSIATSKPYINPIAEADASTGTSIKDTKSFEGFIDAGYDFGPAEVRGGIGYAQAKNSNWNKTDKQMAYYAQLSIPLIAKKLYIKPEVEYRDYMKDKTGAKQGTEVIAGLFIQAFL